MDSERGPGEWAPFVSSTKRTYSHTFLSGLHDALDVDIWGLTFNRHIKHNEYVWWNRWEMFLQNIKWNSDNTRKQMVENTSPIYCLWCCQKF